MGEASAHRLNGRLDDVGVDRRNYRKTMRPPLDGLSPSRTLAWQMVPNLPWMAALSRSPRGTELRQPLLQRGRGGKWPNYVCTDCRKPASFAVALNWGIGSSSLNADVKAFDRLHSVRGSNSG